ncbi:MAG TPA: autotransporter-associated beta strand repeat-containing protein, partial [Desulfuromonadaceae bacterium]|nr:autotransporter-associated beta strand repeat-containing protein [Desulfuromonadaceae bacterium]
GLNAFGGTFNLAGSTTFNISSGTSLELTNVIAGTGSFTKTGSGTLTVDGTNTYSGSTTISAGKFVVNGVLTGGGALTTSAGTTFAPDGGTTGSATIGGALFPNDLTGIGTFKSGSLTLSSGATATFEIRTNANDLLQVTGNLTLNNNSITIVPLDNLRTNLPYTLVTYTGTRSGTFNPVLNLDTNFTATLDYSTPGQVNLVFSRIMTFTIPTAYPVGTGPMNVTMGANGKLVYWPDTNGDIIPDFSKAGYMAGEVPIPTNIPVVTTLSPIAGDNQPQIQNAINALSAQPLGTNGFRGVIYLNAGVYNMSNGLSCTASGIIVRGAGCATNGTLLHLLAGHAIWTVNNPSGVSRKEVASTRHNVTSDYVPLGANWFQVDSVANWAVGDDIVIYRPSTALWCQVIDTAVQYPLSWTGGEVDLTWERKITAIEGNRIMIDSPIFCALDQQYGGGQVYKYTYSNRVQNVGLEGIRADCEAGVDDLGNTSGQLITYDGVMNCWVRNCMNDKMSGHTVKADGSKFCTFEDIISYHNPLPAGHSGPSIQINTHGGSQGLLFHRFTTSDGGFEFSSGGQSSGPNVVLECDIPHAFASTSPHMKWAVGTLYDAMFMHQGLVCLDAGGSHGWCGGNHIAWNDECSGFDYDRPVTAHQMGIGLVASGSTWDPNRTGTLPPEIISWQSHVDPRSLFRAQLAERLGAQKVLDVLGRSYGDNYFLLTAQTNRVSAAPGQSANVALQVTTVASYPGANFIPNPAGSVAVSSWPNSNIVFSVGGLPWGCGAAFNTASLTNSGTNALTLIASNNAAVGNYWVLPQGNSLFPNIRGGNSPLTQYAPVLLNVTGPNNFLLSASPAGQSVFANSSTNFTVQVSAMNGFNGPVTLSITNLPPGVSASFSPGIVTGAGASILTLTVSNNAFAGNYTLTVLGSNSGLVSGATASLNVISTALPPPWVDADVGSQTNKGSASYFNNVFTGVGGGSDVWGTADQFNYIFQPQSGDFAITARVISQTAADAWSKAGVMIRETTNSNAKYAFALISPTASHGASLQYRTTTGGSAVNAADVNGPAVPYWVRLVRSSNSFTAFRSADGVAWNQVTNAVSITMSNTVLVGLAVCAHNSSTVSTATFDNVSIDYPSFTLDVSPTTQSVDGNDSVTYAVSLQNNFGFNGNVSLSVGGIPFYSTATFSPVTINGTNVSTLTVVTTNTTPPDIYNLDIVGTNGLLVDEESAELVVTNAIDSDGDTIPDWWMQQTFGHATGQSGDHSRAQDDFDNDWMSNVAEYICATDPLDSASYLHLLSASPQGSDDDVTWAAVGGVSYVVQVSTNLATGFSDASPVITPDGDTGTVQNWVNSGAATNAVPRFYRVRVSP